MDVDSQSEGATRILLCSDGMYLTNVYKLHLRPFLAYQHAYCVYSSEKTNAPMT